MEKEIINYPELNGISVTERNIPNKFPAHWHNAAEFTVILEDGCSYKIGDTVYKPEAGDILLAWPRELHEILNAPDNSSFFIQFSSGFMEANTDLVAALRFFKSCHLISSKKEPDLTEKLRAIFDKIRDSYNQKERFAETRCKLYVYEMLVQIGEYVMREHQEQLGDEKYSNKSWNYIRTACNYIAEHASENITQSDVATYTGLSPYYFSKLFNEYTDMSFPAYLSGIRVKNAIHLLSNEQLSITDCAFMAGFQSTTTFNKIFLEITGCTPREFRKLHRHNS